MSWMQTFTGRAIHFDRTPRPDEIDITDIAVALSRLCRFNGHAQAYYSVAQHSVIVAAHVPLEHALAALLHDAHEAYLGDITTPLKDGIAERASWGCCSSDPVRDMAAGFDDAIEVRFGLRRGALRAPVIKLADARALATEKRDLMAPCANGWKPTAEPFDSYRIEPKMPLAAESMFLAAFDAFGGRR